MRLSVTDRFEKKYIAEPNSGCWLWLGALHSAGYGTFFVDGVKAYAHRYSYEHHVGEIPDGLVIDHLCRNRLCVNPDHLEVVLQRTNVQRGISPVAVNMAKTACHAGHKFTDDSTYMNSRDQRNCKVCHRIKNASTYACACGSSTMLGNVTRHLRTDKHRKLMEKL